MNRNLKALLFLAISSLLINTAFMAPKKAFEGVITYKLKLKDIPAEQENMLKSSMPSSIVTSYKDGAVRTVTHGGGLSMMGMGDVLGKDGKTYYLQPEQKIAYEQKDGGKDLTDKEKAELEEVKKGLKKEDATKEILGYTCHRYRLDLGEKAMGATAIIYATEEIDLGGASGFSGNTGMDMSKLGIKGTPLLTEMILPQFTIMITATGIEEKKLDKDLFSIPEDYEIKPFAELKGAMMGK